MNLHHVVRSGIRAINQDREWVLFRSLGNVTQSDGSRCLRFSSGIEIFAQVQQPKPNETTQSNHLSVNTITRKIYLYSKVSDSIGGYSLARPLARSSDYLADEGGNLWSITSLEEDFSREGWVSVVATVTTNPPDALKEVMSGKCKHR